MSRAATVSAAAEQADKLSQLREAEGRQCRKQERAQGLPFCALLPPTYRMGSRDAQAWMRGYMAENA